MRHQQIIEPRGGADPIAHAYPEMPGHSAALAVPPVVGQMTGGLRLVGIVALSDNDGVVTRHGVEAFEKPGCALLVTAEPEVGKVYEGRITKIMAFGAFCEFLPGQEGLIHVSELSGEYVKEVSDVVKEGQAVKVKLIGIDDQNRVKLSIKQVEEDKS